MNKPRIFVSSTIYDFKDLRSALKYWLEEQGYEVRMSERNDFVKNSRQNSYQACLDSIKECDYFILLIGSRAGGYYSKNQSITITQKEYQYANELAQQGIIKKIIVFVRQSIWDIKEDRKALQRYIKTELIKDNDIEEEADKINLVTKQSSTIIKSADIIFKFIDEVAKIEDMKAAVQKGEDYPERNWINQFNNFEDIVNVLKIELNAKINIELKKWNQILKQEISQNLARLSNIVGENEIVPFFKFATLARKKVPQKWGENYSLNGKEAILLRDFAVGGILQGDLLSMEMLNAAVNSGVYLKYDKETNQFISGNLQRALLDMITCIKGMKRQKQLFGINEMVSIATQFLDVTENSAMNLNSGDMNLFMVYAAHDYQFNVYQLSKYILGIFSGKIGDENYPSLYKEGVFQNWGNNTKAIVVPEEAYNACMNDLQNDLTI